MLKYILVTLDYLKPSIKIRLFLSSLSGSKDAEILDPSSSNLSILDPSGSNLHKKEKNGFVVIKNK